MKLASEPVAPVVVRDAGVGTVADCERSPLGVGERGDEHHPGRRVGGAHVADRGEIEPALRMSPDEHDVRVRQRRRSDGVAPGLGAPGESHVRVAVDDRSNLLPNLRVRLDDEDPEAGGIG